MKIVFFIDSSNLKSRNSSKFFAVLCSGSDEINPLKVKQHLDLTETPVLASSDIVQEITGADPGSCGPWQMRKTVPIYVDHTLKSRGNFITGANKNGFHVRNINPIRDFEIESYGDFCYAKEGDRSPNGDSILKKHRGIEVGHLFYLSDLYSKMMNLTYLDKQGKKKYVEMGCYGLGVTRTIQAIVEQNHDNHGIIWPLCIAPCSVHICVIDPFSSSVLKAQEELLGVLSKKSLDYFIDDRKERPGVKFKDADLLGLPMRINLGERDLKNSQIEVFIRKTGYREKLSLVDFQKKLSEFLQDL